jgi:heavy metal translocating P-type ATPase
VLKKWLDNEPKVTLACVGVSAVALVLSITGALKDFLPVDIAWIAIILCGIPILIGAFMGVVFEHDIKADLLVSLALIASAATGEFFAAGEVALIMQIGSLLEDFTSGNARKNIEKLIKLTPQTARVVRGGEETILPVEEVRVGDILSVIAGETIPVDGTILSGETSIDQSVMTGESLPVDKAAGDTVLSGTVNRYGTFTMRCDHESEESSLKRMVRLTQEAEKNKAPIVLAADRWATWLVVIALACAVVTGLVTRDFMRSVTVLVVFCPCAFILATPTAVLAGMGNAAKRGIIIKSGEALERLSRIRWVAFDKTGTLTYGKPQVIEVRSLDSRYSSDDILRLAACVEQKSEHPLGKAICEYFAGRGGKADTVEDFKMFAAQGVSGTVDGRRITVGKQNGAAGAEAGGSVKEQPERGATIVYVHADERLIGCIALADVVRDDAAAMVQKLKEVKMEPLLLTGDNASAADHIAHQVGIDTVHADLMPEDKVRIIREYSASGRPVCMIGDGVNDAPALTGADAGIAMGGIGSDIAIESADAVLVSDDIQYLPYLFDMMQKVMKKIRVNILASLCINLSAVLLSAFGLLTPVTGALWHNFGSVFVVVNAALLLRK